MTASGEYGAGERESIYAGWLGRNFEELDTPALCLDLPAVERNIDRMANFLRGHRARLRPHSKTHKSPAIAEMQLAAGAIGITCAKLGEAEVMAAAGVRDILVANQIVGSTKIARLMLLARATDIMVAVDDADNVAEVDAAARASGLTLRVLVEVNVGLNRCGVEPGDATLALARRVVSAPGLRFEGLMGYEGHAVFVPDRDERKGQTDAALAALMYARDCLIEDGIEVKIVSGGGTGTFDITGAHAGMTEIQAGSYATMDANYREVVKVPFEYGVFVAAEVISTARPGAAVVDLGMKAITKDFGMPKVGAPEGWEIVALSEEHATLKSTGGRPLHLGDRVMIYPNHGCTTINLHDRFFALRDGRVEAIWPVAARGKSQ